MSFDITPPQKKSTKQPSTGRAVSPTPKPSVAAVSKSQTHGFKSKKTSRKKARPKKQRRTVNKKLLGIGIALLLVGGLGFVAWQQGVLHSSMFDFFAQDKPVPQSPTGIISTFPSAQNTTVEEAETAPQEQAQVPTVVQKQEDLIEQIDVTTEYAQSILDYETTRWDVVHNYLELY